MAARLKELYKNEIAPALFKKFEYTSVMQIPKLDKIVVNVELRDLHHARVLELLEQSGCDLILV